MGAIIIDKRLNPGDKNLTNRQRFLDRANQAIRESAKKSIKDKSISGGGGDTNIIISSDGIREPFFHYDYDFGIFDYTIPGNKEFIPGDTIPKNQEDAQGNRNGGGHGDVEYLEDGFGFSLTNDEFQNIIFDGLELPDLVKKSEKSTITWSVQRAGFTNSGVPANLNIERTMVSGIGRRIALRAAKANSLEELEQKLLETEDEDIRLTLMEEILDLKSRVSKVPFLDTVDLKYNNFIRVPKPMTKAVMICIMDVSYSMGMEEKIIAKKFFLLLNLFLQRKYEQVDIVFIRHHDKAKECGEEEFFYSKETGGTIVSSAYALAVNIIKDRYSPADWNIYLSQVSDGDNAFDDNEKALAFLQHDLLPVVQYFTYIEIKPQHAMFNVPETYAWANHGWLYTITRALASKFKNIGLASVTDENQVIPMFRKLFGKKENG